MRDVKLRRRRALYMKAELSQIYAMVEQMEVSVRNGEATIQKGDDGRYYRCMRRIHKIAGKPFCHVDIRLNDDVFAKAPARFADEIVIAVLKELGIPISRARQRITVSYADFKMAKALGVPVNSAVFRVYREFLDDNAQLIYSATLYYPADLLELEMEFSTD